MEKFVNRDGVTVDAEIISEGEFARLWRTVDANGVEGHVTDEQFQHNWILASAAPTAPKSATKD